MATNQMRREAAKRKLERQQQRRIQQAQRKRRITVITSVAVVVVVLVGVVVFSVVGGDKESAGTDSADPAAAAQREPVTPAAIPTEPVALPSRPTPLPPTLPCAYQQYDNPAKPVTPPAAGEVSTEGTVAVTLQMNAGTVPLTLDRSLAPCAVHSFVTLAGQGYFDETRCHRLTTAPGLQVLQCGDPSGTGAGGPGYRFADETFPELTYGRGLLAMANSGPNTNGSQFFMVYGDAQLPPNYTVFGSISPEGLQVVDQIARTGHDGSLDPSPGGGAPVQPVTIQSVTVS